MLVPIVLGRQRGLPAETIQSSPSPHPLCAPTVVRPCARSPTHLPTPFSHSTLRCPLRLHLKRSTICHSVICDRGASHVQSRWPIATAPTWDPSCDRHPVRVHHYSSRKAPGRVFPASDSSSKGPQIPRLRASDRLSPRFPDPRTVLFQPALGTSPALRRAYSTHDSPLLCLFVRPSASRLRSFLSLVLPPLSPSLPLPRPPSAWPWPSTTASSPNSTG